MKNNSKGNRAKIEIELLLRKALRVQQEPSQQLNDSIIRQCEKRNEQGADQILGDGRIVIGIERDNHKEIENCQNQKKDEEIKVVDYSQFEASTKSGIHADVNRIRQKDEIIRAVVKKRRNSAISCVCFVCMAGISLLKGWIPALICILIALFFLWRAVGKFSDEYLRELYEEGLLVPGMIVKTEPLTIMAIANMVAQEGAAAVNGCYCLEVKELDGAKKELFEKIPCSCFFCYKGGKYHSSFQPHPLYWGTMDQQVNSVVKKVLV